ncbi:LysR family transcriptional regulator [Streptomyces althioticus]|uniref:LysR family transcriptional regulator n=1 Tax=Streptomyces althioticus TaxID=83380 RepID=UPI0033E5BD1F
MERLDLNLLPPLAVLLEEKHVSRAAHRFHLSQPAMSRILQRLRDTFDDELLVRTPTGYQLTPVAERLQRHLTALLPQISNLFSPQDFAPQFASEEFVLAGTDYAASTIGQRLMRTVLRESPNSRLDYQTWHEGVFEDLERGTIHLAFYGATPPSSLSSEHLFDETFVCVVDRDHPLAGRNSLDLETYLSALHVVVDVFRGRQGIVDTNLHQAGAERSIGLAVPYHHAALHAIVGTTFIATLPLRILGGTLNTNGALRIIAAPDVIRPMSYLMVWHPRLDDDPAQRWIREQARAAAVHPEASPSPREDRAVH